MRRRRLPFILNPLLQGGVSLLFFTTTLLLIYHQNSIAQNNNTGSSGSSNPVLPAYQTQRGYALQPYVLMTGVISIEDGASQQIILKMHTQSGRCWQLRQKPRTDGIRWIPVYEGDWILNLPFVPGKWGNHQKSDM